MAAEDMMRARKTTVRAFPEPETMKRGIYGSCKWCGLEILDEKTGQRSTRRYWHPACKDEYFLHTRSEEQRAFVIARDGEKCSQFGGRPMKWLRGDAAMIVAPSWTSEPWALEFWSREELGQLPRSFYSVAGQTLDRDAWMLHGGQCSIVRVSALELDHRVPLWSVAHLPDEERRRFYGPENLWLLCPAGHKAKTKREAAERAKLRRAA